MQPHSDFVHLHVHSEYSLLDGASRLSQLIAKAKEFHMPALALTDHGNLFGAIKFYQEARKQGIKPIIGCEFYISPRSRFEKAAKPGEKPYFHFTVLARNEEGYRNLMRLASSGYLEGYYYRPRIDMELLEKYHEGLLALSGCLRGQIPSLLANDEYREAEELAKKFAMLYGEGNFYLEMHDHAISFQQKVNEGLAEISKKTGLPLVASNDVHYTNREDHMAHDILLCIQTGNVVSNEKRLKFKTNEFYFKSPDEMKALFAKHPAAVTNTIRIAERCNLELDLKSYHLPKFNIGKGEDPSLYLYKLCEEGILKKYGEDRKSEKKIRDRLDQEFRVIKKMGFVDYFLITWDLIRFAKSQSIPVGPGRGSAAGSIVAYLLDITDIDPLKYDRLFERFLNESRISMPDIDIDFCYERREEVIKYVTDKYGADKVAQIITFGTMAAKAAIRDVGRVLGVPLSDVDKIAKMVPAELNITIKEAIEKVPELKECYITNDTFRNLLDYAINLEGMTRHASTHAAGIVISETPLTENTPLFLGSESVVTTQYDMESVEKIGLLKMDFLGLKTLTVIDETVHIVKRTRGVDIDIAHLPLDDPKAFTLLNEGLTTGVFQLESSGMKSLMRKLKVDNFEEIIALIALYRPGPMNMLPDFIGRKHGVVPIKYDTPLEEPILKNTYGIMLYQEQVMQIVHEIGKFSLAEADNFRKAISKKIPEVMDQNRKKFIDGSVSNGLKPETAEKIFNDIVKFAGYGFNKSHSAAYAVISYRTAYLKANFTIEFMAALLDSELGNTDKIVEYIDECKSLSIPLLPPCINESFSKFTVTKDGIRFGLAAVKNVGESAVDSIITERKGRGPYRSIFDFCERNQTRLVNKRVNESLIKCGAFDTIHKERARVWMSLEKAVESAQRSQYEKKNGQISLFESSESEKPLAEQLWSLPDCPEWSEAEKLANEKEVLGFFVTGHPLTKHTSILKVYGFVNSDKLKGMAQAPGDVRTCGLVTSIRMVTTKRNERMAFLTLEDLAGTYPAVVFPSVYERLKNMIKEDLPLCFIGHADVRNDEVQLIVSDIFLLNDICTKFTKEIILNISKTIDPTRLEYIKSLLEVHKGNCPVVINVVNGSEKIRLRTSQNYFIFPSERFLDDINEILGADNVVCVANQTAKV